MARKSTYTREIKYLNKDFAAFRQDLINYAKNYFPNTVNDFNESSPSTMFIEMASFVGDVLSFYSDVQLQESFLTTAEERINLYNLAQSHGYKAKTVVPASVELDIFQLIPSIGSGDQTRPDFKYALVVEENMVVQTDETSPVFFRTIDPVDFRFSSSYDPTTVSVYSVTNDGEVEYYLLKKKVKAVSGVIQTATFDFTEPKPYDKIVIDNTRVTEIIDIYDSDSNRWYEVPFMAQDLIPVSIINTPYNDTRLSLYRDSVPYILSYHATEKRFVTRLRKDEKFEIQFGSGMSSESDEEIVPNPFNVGLGLSYYERVTDVSIDPQNFLYTKTYGSAPTNTTLTIRYATANGLRDNVNSNTITKISSYTTIDPADTTINRVVLSTLKDSLSVNNPNPAYGGQDRKPMDVIREEAIANFAAQNRAVTREDYILRCFTMPAKYGSVCKAYVEQDMQVGGWNERDLISNMNAIDLYVLSYDNNKKFVYSNDAIKENLRNYLRQYRLMTDAINIKNPYIVNIGVNFEIIVLPGYNSNEVLLRCVETLSDFFDNDKMTINSPIIISNIYTLLDRVEGVQTVQNVYFENLYDKNSGYSGNLYDVKNATRNGILYPSVDPMIWEVKYPKRDIKGKVNDV